MARILLTTLGSLGDLHPFLALAHALAADGHTPVLATHKRYRDKVEGEGIAFTPMRPGLDELGPDTGWIDRANHPLRGTEFVVRKLVVPFIRESFEDLEAAAARVDLIISHPLTLAAPMVAEKHAVPWLSTALSPNIFFSYTDPPIVSGMPFIDSVRKAGPGAVKAYFAPVRWATAIWMMPVVKLRRDLGLNVKLNPLMRGGFSPHGTLATFSAALAPPQPDWPTNVSILGFPGFDRDGTADLSAPLTAFLAAGEPPLVFTLGSSVVNMDSDFFAEAYRATKAAGRRAVFLVGHAPRALSPAVLADPAILVTPYEPHSQLFRRAKVIVHQCGIGTAAQATAAAVPQVLVPFAHDQPDNAARLAALGVGLVIPARRISASRLTAAFLRLETESSFTAAAKKVAPSFASDGFASKAAAAVRITLSQRRA